ncbi:unnamed protein product [Cylicocyclus nassatus]|uniref:Uncharacterized protein n=1 Tax=Cylicocyclus nassatus TaxID=53992 RepID=A0AA36DWB1_CYLNA|nr:unnamed protein product [Cylicocyclus nassatus]
MSDDECPEAADFITYVPQHVVLFGQLLLCMATIAINLIFIRRWRKNLFFHINFRILLWTIITVNIGHSVFLGPLQVKPELPQFNRDFIPILGTSFIQNIYGDQAL